MRGGFQKTILVTALVAATACAHDGEHLAGTWRDEGGGLTVLFRGDAFELRRHEPGIWEESEGAWEVRDGAVVLLESGVAEPVLTLALESGVLVASLPEGERRLTRTFELVGRWSGGSGNRRIDLVVEQDGSAQFRFLTAESSALNHGRAEHDPEAGKLSLIAERTDTVHRFELVHPYRLDLEMLGSLLRFERQGDVRMVEPPYDADELLRGKWSLPNGSIELEFERAGHEFTMLLGFREMRGRWAVRDATTLTLDVRWDDPNVLEIECRPLATGGAEIGSDENRIEIRPVAASDPLQPTLFWGGTNDQFDGDWMSSHWEDDTGRAVLELLPVGEAVVELPGRLGFVGDWSTDENQLLLEGTTPLAVPFHALDRNRVDILLEDEIIRIRRVGLAVDPAAEMLVPAARGEERARILEALDDLRRWDDLTGDLAFEDLPVFGRKVWDLVAVEGFEYVSTLPFLGGGERHAIVLVRHEQTGLEFSLVPGGECRLQATSEDREGVKVLLSPFLIARTEVPQAVWDLLPRRDDRLAKIPRVAMSDMSGTEVMTWCNQLDWRLPNEAEWEYACRAGTSGDMSFGDGRDPEERMWWSANSRDAREVGLFDPNAFGLHDMHGNVAEWVADYWHDSLDEHPMLALEPWTAGANKDYRVARGGSFRSSDLHDLTSWARQRVYLYTTEPWLGFRPVVDLEVPRE